MSKVRERTVVASDDFYFGHPMAYVAWPYPSFRLSLLYGNILGIELAWKLEVSRSNPVISTAKYKDALNSLANILPIDLNQLPRRPLASRVKLSDEFKCSTYSVISPMLLQYCANNDFDILVSSGYFDDYIAIASSIGNVKLKQRLKKTRLRWEVLNFLLKRYVPRLNLTNVSDPYLLKAPAEAIASWIENYCSTKNMYTLNNEMEAEIESIVANKVSEFDRIFNTVDKLRMLPNHSEVATIVLSVAVGSLIPMGSEVINSMIKTIRILRARRLELGIVVALALFGQLMVGGAEKAANCKICSLTMSEIDNAIESDSDDLSLFGELCMDHMVAYLNGRKVHHFVGPSLVRFMKSSVK